MPVAKNHTTLDARKTIVDKTKISRETIKQVFWQKFVNDQRQKLTITINYMDTEDLIDTNANVTIIAPKTLHPDWHLQGVNVQLLGTGTLFQIK